MHYTEKFYNHGDSCIPSAIRSEISNFIQSGINCDARSKTNSDLERKLHERGWKAEAHIGQGRIDFKKDDVGLEVELRQGTNLIHDLLKLELAARTGIISCGVIITYDRSVPIRGENGMDACLQKFDELVKEFSGIIDFRLPLWVLGLLDETLTQLLSDLDGGVTT